MMKADIGKEYEMKQDKKNVFKKITALAMIIVILALSACVKVTVNPGAISINYTGNASPADIQITDLSAEEAMPVETEPETPPAEEEEVYQPSATVIFYGSGCGDLGWDMEDAVVYGMLGVYNTSDINYIAVLGGQNEWSERYIAELLNTNDDEPEDRTGFFYANVDAVNEKLDELAEEFGIDPLNFEEKLSDDDVGLYDRLRQELFSENLLPQIEGTESSIEYPIEESHTLERTLNIVREQFPADNYYIILAGHGNGSRGGVCYSQKSSEDSDGCLSIPEIDEALNNAGFGDDLKFDLLAFDACGMGGIELGVRLSNYYKYMIGSEVEQMGGLNQCILIRSIVDNRTEENLAYCVAHDAYERKYIDSLWSHDLETDAIFFGPNGNSAAAAIDTAAAELLDAAHQDEYLKTEIYDALKKATMYCYSNFDAPDGRDLFESLLRTLNEKGITQFDEVIQGAISGINDFMVDNWYSFDSGPMYNTLDGGVTPEKEKYREEYMDHNLCGGTLCAINYPKFTEAYSAGSVEDFIQSGTDTLNEFDDNYYKSYKDYGFENYAQLMKEYAEYFFQEDFYYKEHTLAADLADAAGADYQDITDIRWSDDGKAIQLEIVNYGDEIAADSSGDSLVDFFDTTASYQAYLTRKMPVTRSADGEQIDLDYIIGNKALEPEGMEAAHRMYNFFMARVIHTNIQYIKNPSANADAAVDIIIPWEKNSDYWCKVDVLKAAFSIDEEEAGSIAEQYEIYDGWCRINGDSVDMPALHIFKRINDNNYQYAKTVLVESTEDQCEYIPVDYVDAIKFKHYYLRDDIGTESVTGGEVYDPGYYGNEFQPYYDNSIYYGSTGYFDSNMYYGNNGYYDNNIYSDPSYAFDQVTVNIDDTGSESGKCMKFLNTGCLEDDFFSVYDDDMYWYSSDMLDQLAISIIDVSSVDDDPQKYGYYITGKPILSGDSLVLFNKNGAALQGSSYEQMPVYGNVQ